MCIIDSKLVNIHILSHRKIYVSCYDVSVVVIDMCFEVEGVVFEIWVICY